MPDSHSQQFSPSFFLQQLDSLAYAYGKPTITGRLKHAPEDFRVIEVMDVEPSGEGEHFWLDITKTSLSTDRVAKSLARYARVAYRDVGYAGMKDVHAVTRQWFSVWMPKHASFDWGDFGMEGVTVHTVVKHNRKLKRGAHQANRFELILRELSENSEVLSPRLELIRTQGVPNYYGEQRFGRQANNLSSAHQLFVEDKKIRDKTLRGLVLSAARSFLFNLVISERVRSGTWEQLFENEPAALDGSNAIFNSNKEPDNAARMTALDIHATAPLWGRAYQKASEVYPKLFDFEMVPLNEYEHFRSGLERFGLEYQRRALRLAPKQMSWNHTENDLMVSFTLQSGQFATSVVRELIQTSE